MLKGDIVERPAARQDRLQCLLLLWRWREFVLVTFAHMVALLFHRPLFYLTGKKLARSVAVVVLWATRLSSPCLKGRGLQPVSLIMVNGCLRKTAARCWVSRSRARAGLQGISGR